MVPKDGMWIFPRQEFFIAEKNKKTTQIDIVGAISDHFTIPKFYPNVWMMA